MPRLCQITVPGLHVPTDWRTVHDRLLDEFPEIDDVLATTIGATVLIVYEGRSHVDQWLESVSGSIVARRAGVRVHDRAS
jgi:hypothetical protein